MEKSKTLEQVDVEKNEMAKKVIELRKMMQQMMAG